MIVGGKAAPGAMRGRYPMDSESGAIELRPKRWAVQRAYVSSVPESGSGTFCQHFCVAQCNPGLASISSPHGESHLGKKSQTLAG